MADFVEFFVQVFTRPKAGRLVALPLVIAASASEALRIAESLAPRFLGAAAVAVHRHEGGDVWMIRYLQKYGELPNELGKTLLELLPVTEGDTLRGE